MAIRSPVGRHGMDALSASPVEAASPMTLGALLAALRRRWSWIAWPVGVCVLAAGITCLLATPQYRATAEIQVQKEDGGAFGLESTVTGSGGNGASDSLDYNTTLQTAAGVLRSPVLALQVIHAAGLEPTKEYFGGKAKLSLSSLFSFGFLRSAASRIEPLSTPLQEAPNRRYAALKIFAAHAKIQPLAGTRLIDVSYSDPSPQKAQEAANDMALALADITFEQRFEATLQGSSWLSKQLEQLRTQAQEAQSRAVRLQRGTGLFGNDASRNVVLARLDTLNQALVEAQENRILKESIYRTAMTHSPEVISSLSGNSSSGSSASINTSLTLIQGLRAQEATARSTLALDSVRYGPKYPEIAELKAQLAVLVASIQAETVRLGERAQTDWLIAQREEADAGTAFTRQKQLAMQQNDSVIAYQLARQEADSSRDLYESLFAKLKQSTLLSGIRSNNVTVVSPATVPSLAHPASPNVVLRLAAAIAFGLLLGACLAMVREATDNSLSSLHQLESVCGVPLLAMLPALDDGLRSRFKLYRYLPPGMQGSSEQLSRVVRDPFRPLNLEARSFLYVESMRALRTSLSLSRGGESPKVILVTSCLAGEGKTTLSVNLAAMFAQSGARTLLIDADLRRPSIRSCLSLTEENCAGLATALSAQQAAGIEQPFPELASLCVLAGSETPAYPQQLLGSQRMKDLMGVWRRDFDVIVVDSPPALPVSDARLLNQLADVTLLVARHRQTSRQALVRTVAILEQPAERSPIGVVLNDVARDTQDFFEYFGHRGGLYASEPA